MSSHDAHGAASHDPDGHNFPITRTSLIGRERAAAEVRSLLDATHLVTVAGTGGSGKTRLALRVAQEARSEYPDGVWWVDLAALTDPELLPQTVASVLGIAEQTDRSVSDLLLDYLPQRSALLILDNCEHLRRACADLLEAIFASDGAARVLATSREPLAVADEQVWIVPLLALPDPHASVPIETLKEIEAVRLFVERAQAVMANFDLHERNAAAVVQICNRLDGLPLAIELAAARITVLAPAQIAERLDNSMRLLTRGTPESDARHRTLRDAMDWSFALLATPEQTLFTRLAVFAGHFALEAVEGICPSLGLERDELLDLLASLVEKSLVVAAEQGEEMRYRLLEPIRDYAAELLSAGGDEAHWRKRHADYFLALAERAEPELHGPDQARWLDRLEREHDNARAALAWLAAHTCVEKGLRLGAALHHFWLRRGYLSEGQRWVGIFLAKTDETTSPEVQIDALNASAGLSRRQSNFALARTRYEQALALAQRAEYEEGIERVLTGLGVTFWELGDFPAARTTLEEAVQVCRAAGHAHALGAALGNLALVHQYQSEAAQARAYYEEALSIDRHLGNTERIAVTLFNLAMLAEQSGDHVSARLGYQEVLDTNRRLGNRSRVADTLLNLGQLTADLGDFVAAEDCFAEAAQIYREASNWGDLGYVFAGRGDIAFYSRQYGPARAHYLEALRLFREASNQRLISRALGSLGCVAVRDGNLTEGAALCAESLTMRRAIGHRAGMIFSLERGYIELAVAVGRSTVGARLLGAVEAAREALARPRKPMEAREVELLRRKLQIQLGDVSLTSLWNEGRGMSLEQAATYALEDVPASPLEQPRPTLRIFALGPVRIYLGDRLLTSADWTYAKARELVLYLLCHADATQAEIAAQLWPDATTRQVRQRFSAALSHARRALGRDVEWIILADRRYRFNREQPYWFDVDVFETGLREAQALLRTGTQDERATSRLEEAVNLYQNEFASDVLDGEWHVARREALRHDYLEALLALGRLRARAGRDERAIVPWKTAIGIDPYLEDAHLEVIRAYGRLGRRRQALEQYETLKIALAELKASPSLETTALIERLRRDPR